MSNNVILVGFNNVPHTSHPLPTHHPLPLWCPPCVSQQAGPESHPSSSKDSRHSASLTNQLTRACTATLTLWWQGRCRCRAWTRANCPQMLKKDMVCMHYISHRVYILEIFHFHRFHIVNKLVFGLGAIVKLPRFTTYKSIFKLSKYNREVIKKWAFPIHYIWLW